MYKLLILAILSFLASSALNYFLKNPAKRIGLVAGRQRDRWRSDAVPLIGGIGIMVCVLAAFFLTFSMQLLPIIAVSGTLGIFIVGFVDDKYGLKPQIKMLLQVLIALAAVFAGLTISITGFLVLDKLLVVFWLVAITNAFNLLDNMDGLTSSVAIISGMVMIWIMHVTGHPEFMPILAAFIGALAGFMIYNLPPASAFLGDAGSMVIGFFLGSLSLVSVHATPGRIDFPLVVPFIVLAIPVFDMCFVSVTRIFRGRSPFQGGRDHTSHRLVLAGFSEKKTLLVFTILASITSLVGIVVLKGWIEVSFAVMIYVLALLLLGIYLAHVRISSDEVIKREPDEPKEFFFGYLLSMPYKRQIATVLLDIGLLSAAYLLSYVIRFEDTALDHMRVIEASLPIVLFCQLLSMAACGVYSGVWRYSSVTDTLALLKGLFWGILSSVVIILAIWRFNEFSRALFVVDFLVACAFLCSSRFAFKMLDAVIPRTNGKSEDRCVLIYGAGDGGELLARVIPREPLLKKRIVGFVDDDKDKKGQRIHGIRVIGGFPEMSDFIEQMHVKEIILSSAKINGNNLESLKKLCKNSRIKLSIPSWKLESLV
ncbi:hypothetical protein ACFL6Y_04715 [Elusimicrobiota bacterium]